MTGHYQQSYAEAVSGTRQSNAAASYNGLQLKQDSKGPFIVVEVEVLSEDKDFDLIVKVKFLFLQKVLWDHNLTAKFLL